MKIKDTSCIKKSLRLKYDKSIGLIAKDTVAMRGYLCYSQLARKDDDIEFLFFAR